MTPEQEIKLRTRRSFLALGAGAAGVAGAVAWAWNSPMEDEIPGALRSALGFNEKVVRAALFSDTHLAATYPGSAVGRLKKNGDVGIEQPVDAAAWRLVTGGRQISMDEIRQLPRTEETIDFKCVEGWSTITRFAGVRLADFTAKFAPGAERKGYVALETPDHSYYVGLDMPSALHPQTLLAYEMNGAPLNDDHGAPLRLVIPTKYGIKNLKRIGSIEYSNDRPRDYWAEQGYDWYAGL